ncbi:MOSC domain-containing protein [Paraglaciecola aestuariivivens]
MKIIGLYAAASPCKLGDKGRPTGINKQPIDSAYIDKLGIQGDLQIDTRVHGGPEKALHQFSHYAYQKIIQAYPLLHKKALPGSIGENLSVNDMHELNVCIGDEYQIGEVVLQVSAPRVPCWKIDAKFVQPNLHKLISERRISGWYYRVLKAGKIQLTDTIELQQRPNPELNMDTILKVLQGKTEPELARQAAYAEGLDPQWQQRLINQYKLN